VVVSLVPVVFGSGRPFFGTGGPADYSENAIRAAWRMRLRGSYP
jgi:hypothetical protein